MAAVSVVPSILDYVGDDVIRNQLLPRAKFVHSANGADVKIVLSLLACIAKVNLVGAYLSALAGSSLHIIIFSVKNIHFSNGTIHSLALSNWMCKFNSLMILLLELHFKITFRSWINLKKVSSLMKCFLS